MDAETELQLQQAGLRRDKTRSQCSAATFKPKHERCVHFHSHYKPEIYFNNVRALLRAGKLRQQTLSLAFQRQPGSV